jgi:hypothetical protein
LGTDFRVAREVAIAPYVAGDLNIMFSETLPNGNSRGLNGPPVFASFTAGLLGRFDIGGRYLTPAGAVAVRQ